MGRAATEAVTPTEPDSSDDEEKQEKVVDLVALAKRAAALPVLPGFAGFGLVRGVSFTNHSCDGSLDIEASADTADVIATAHRDIAAGEEVSMGYVDDEQPRRVRQRNLLKNYHFLCRCPRCLAEEQGAG